jgi:hypothetical protein
MSITDEKKIMLGVRSSSREESSTIDESGKHRFRDDEYSGFICKKDNVLIGRWHEGDENGATRYLFGPLSIINDEKEEYKIVLSDVMFSAYMQEKDSYFPCPDSCVLVGREHTGDENGKTRYAYRRIGIQKKTVLDQGENPFIQVKPAPEYDATVETKESSGKWSEKLYTIEGTMPEVTYYAPMYARRHEGDENGLTKTSFALFTPAFDAK